MRRLSLIVLVVAVVVCAGAVGFWMASGGPEKGGASGPPEPAGGARGVAPPEKGAEAEPTRIEPPAPVSEGHEQPDRLPEGFLEALTEGTEKPFEGVPITDETLKGCKYRQDRVVVEFAADHRWLFNGEARAKWEIVGNRVRIYDDKGEEHFVDIRGDKLMVGDEHVPLWK
ncbi:MAG: hypothetical protein JXR94_16510 [Candidatus Hydrogenedentes bacterium]|nr:hypothetical protein [Candidatus Hydrogenedentota bacterium]